MEIWIGQTRYRDTEGRIEYDGQKVKCGCGNPKYRVEFEEGNTRVYGCECGNIIRIDTREEPEQTSLYKENKNG